MSREPNQEYITLFGQEYIISRNYDERGLLISKTMIYQPSEVKHLAEQAVVTEEAKTGEKLDEAEKDRIWNLVRKACGS